MREKPAVATRYQFGPFTLDVSSGELHNGPTRIKVPDQSIAILTALLERPGQVVTRDGLRHRLWPENHFVDFEHGLNAAVRRLREALNDSADTPKFIETLPKRGYRFIAPVAIDGLQQIAVLAPGLPATPRRRQVSRRLVAVIVAIGLLATISVVRWPRQSVALPPSPRIAPKTLIATQLTFETGLQMNPAISRFRLRPTLHTTGNRTGPTTAEPPRLGLYARSIW